VTIPPTVYAIPALALLVATLFVAGVARVAPPERRAAWAFAAALGGLAWYGGTAWLASTGFFADFDARPPRAGVLLGGVLAIGLGVGLSPVGGRLARLPLAVLVGVQVFRLPLELAMHEAATIGLMPAQMSFTGWNFEIVPATLAIPVALLAARGRAPRWLVRMWWVLGTATLLGIIGIAVASLPLFAAFGEAPERLNLWVTRFPWVWLPAGCVAFALLGHVVLARRLFGGERAESG
jgi:hypothetical protein